MQSPLSQEQALADIEAMRAIPSVELPTLRGRIVDRNGKVLAIDNPVFHIYASYQITRLLDERWQNGQYLIELKKGKSPQEAKEYLVNKYAQEITSIYKILDFCDKLGGNYSEKTKEKISKINDAVWRLRTYMAWRRYSPDGGQMANFAKVLPDENQRTILICKERIIEMYRNYPVVELENENAKFAAEIQLSNIQDVSISAESARNYPYNEAACHLIGWVRPVSDENKKLADLLEDDPLASYQGQELAGFRGIEWVCEAALRGRRGVAEFDRDGNIQNKISSKFGNDIQLTIDIELQKKISEVLSANLDEQKPKAGVAAVVSDIQSGEVLAMVSLPEFDLNLARIEYGKLIKDSSKPLTNRALESIYPAGSTLKPLVLIAAIQENKISPYTVISCPAQNAPKGFPNCWIWRQFHSCHDYLWENNARNAIKGSCNIYCSRAANMLNADVLQRWLYQFGFGRRILAEPDLSSVNIDDAAIDELGRNIREAAGVIWTGFASVSDMPFDKLPKISNYEKRMFGIGQGSMRCNVLQAANEMSIIARGGVFKSPKIFKNSLNDKVVDLGIKKSAIDTVKDGMFAVVNENNGTAHKAFIGSGLLGDKLKIYGKTGSTQGSENAWFTCFFGTKADNQLALAVIIEGGQSGAQDAAPVAREVIKVCLNSGYFE